MDAGNAIDDGAEQRNDLQFQLDVVGRRAVVVGLGIEDVEPQLREVARDRGGVALPPAGVVEDRDVHPLQAKHEAGQTIAASTAGHHHATAGASRRAAGLVTSERPILVQEEVDHDAGETGRDEPGLVAVAEIRTDRGRDGKPTSKRQHRDGYELDALVPAWPVERNVQMRLRK